MKIGELRAQQEAHQAICEGSRDNARAALQKQMEEMLAKQCVKKKWEKEKK